MVWLPLVAMYLTPPYGQPSPRRGPRKAFQADPSRLLELVLGCLGYAKTILLNEFGPGGVGANNPCWVQPLPSENGTT